MFSLRLTLVAGVLISCASASAEWICAPAWRLQPPEQDTLQLVASAAPDLLQRLPVRHLSEQESLNAIQARRLLPDGFGEAGMQNEGIYFYRSGGQARVMKLLDLAPESSPTLRSRHVQRFVREVSNAMIAHSLGGPEPYGAGLAERDGQIYLFLEMEWIGAGESIQTLKGFMNLHEEVPANVGRKFAEALLKGVLPVDPDFVIFADGTVRWIDSALWFRHSGLESISEADFGSFWTPYQAFEWAGAGQSANYVSAFNDAIMQSGISPRQKLHLLKLVETGLKNVGALPGRWQP